MSGVLWLVCASSIWLHAACASSPAPRKRLPTKVAEPSLAEPSLAAPSAATSAPATAAVAAPAPAPTRVVKVKGLTGTLNKDDVHQTMEARQEALDGCIVESRRKLRWVSGKIRFAFKVDAEGAVEDVHPTESTIGHQALETCIHGVLAETRFPKPAGTASATFDWGLTVEPATARSPEPIEAGVLDKVLRKHAREILQHCEVKRRRERFTVTAYITRGGRVISAGAVPRPARASEKVECVLEELASLRMPKQKREAKVTFELR